nr:hypothetical protein [uncultured Flavobacterium sp.]
MNNLPILFDDKVNSPELLALMRQFGENTYLTAEEINKMRDGINELFANIGGNQLIQNTGLIRNGQVFTFQPLWVWKILGEYYSNEQIIMHAVQYSQAGYWRMVLFYANAQNEILMNNGQEVPLSQSPYEPTLPANCVRLTALPVYESSYGNWQEPIIGDNFKDKSESSIIDIYNVGSLPNLSVNSNAAHFRIHNASDLKSLYLSEISNNYPGKLFYITNKKNTEFVIPHNASGVNIHQPFVFPTNTNYTVQPNETLTFYWSENKLNYLSSNMSVAAKRTFDLHFYNLSLSISAANVNFVHCKWTSWTFNSVTSFTDLDLVTTLQGSSEIITPYKCKVIGVSGNYGGSGQNVNCGIYKSSGLSGSRLTPIYKFRLLDGGQGISDIVDYNSVIDSNKGIKLGFKSDIAITGTYGVLTVHFEEVL